MARKTVRTMAEGDRKAIGDNIRKRMAELGISQTDVERTAGIRQSMVSKYVNGRCDMRVSAIVILCDVLECTPNDLLAGTFAERSDG